MERKRLVTALMIVLCLGIIIAGIGKFVAMGISMGEVAYIAFDATFQSFIVLFYIALAVFWKDLSNGEQDPSEIDQDSSLY
jgi:TM2 domain-containing membrane protein YozV